MELSIYDIDDSNIDIQEKKQNKFNKIIEEFAILYLLSIYVRPIIHGVEYKGEKYQMVIS